MIYCIILIRNVLTLLHKCFCIEVPLCMLEIILKTWFWKAFKLTNSASISIYAFTMCTYAKVKYINISKPPVKRYHYIHQLSIAEQCICFFISNTKAIWMYNLNLIVFAASNIAGDKLLFRYFCEMPSWFWYPNRKFIIGFTEDLNKNILFFICANFKRTRIHQTLYESKVSV